MKMKTFLSGETASELSSYKTIRSYLNEEVNKF